jgi:hypothetical protein
MWLARCGYISTLSPPAGFSSLLDTVERTPGCQPWMLGVDRSAQEHWATSHPSAVVYDVLPYASTDGRRLAYRWCDSARRPPVSAAAAPYHYDSCVASGSVAHADTPCTHG